MSLVFQGVAAAYRRRQIFAGATLHIAPGEIAGLIGPNGAGKTTMLRIGARLIRPSAGHVDSEGRVIYFGGESTLPGECRADRWAMFFGASFESRRRIGRLSRGTRQSLGLTACLARDDWDVCLLDEPWEGLDPNGSRWLTHTLRRHQERGAAMLISSHRLHDAAEICSSYAFLANGSLRVVATGALAQTGGRVDASDLARAFDEFVRPTELTES